MDIELQLMMAIRHCRWLSVVSWSVLEGMLWLAVRAVIVSTDKGD